jgi:hypothetical protein
MKKRIHSTIHSRRRQIHHNLIKPAEEPSLSELLQQLKLRKEEEKPNEKD